MLTTTETLKAQRPNTAAKAVFIDGAQAVADAEPGGAGLAVDEDGLGGGVRLLRFQGLGRGQHGGSPRD